MAGFGIYPGGNTSGSPAGGGGFGIFAGAGTAPRPPRIPIPMRRRRRRPEEEEYEDEYDDQVYTGSAPNFSSYPLPMSNRQFGIFPGAGQSGGAPSSLGQFGIFPNAGEAPRLPVNIPRMARGGIVTRPTVALIGEEGPEAVVPIAPSYRPSSPPPIPFGYRAPAPSYADAMNRTAEDAEDRRYRRQMERNASRRANGLPELNDGSTPPTVIIGSGGRATSVRGDSTIVGAGGATRSPIAPRSTGSAGGAVSPDKIAQAYETLVNTGVDEATAWQRASGAVAPTSPPIPTGVASPMQLAKQTAPMLPLMSEAPSFAGPPPIPMPTTQQAAPIPLPLTDEERGQGYVGRTSKGQLYRGKASIGGGDAAGQPGGRNAVQATEQHLREMWRVAQQHAPDNAREHFTQVASGYGVDADTIAGLLSRWEQDGGAGTTQVTPGTRIPVSMLGTDRGAGYEQWNDGRSNPGHAFRTQQATPGPYVTTPATVTSRPQRGYTPVNSAQPDAYAGAGGRRNPSPYTPPTNPSPATRPTATSRPSPYTNAPTQTAATGIDAAQTMSDMANPTPAMPGLSTMQPAASRRPAGGMPGVSAAGSAGVTQQFGGARPGPGQALGRIGGRMVIVDKASGRVVRQLQQ